jgi:hypothetical protein
VRRSSTRASGRGEQPEALLEMRSVSDRLARDHALQPYDSKDWTHPHCCFHATIHGLTELRIFNNISMLELWTTVTEWLTTAPEPETEGVIELWAIQRQAASTHTGIFRAQRPSQIRMQWRDHWLWRIARYPRQSKGKSAEQKDKYSQKCARGATLYKSSLPVCSVDNVDKLRMLHPEGKLDYPKDSWPSLQQEAEFWEGEEGRNLASAHPLVMMMPFICSYRNKNEPTAIYPSFGYSPTRKRKEAHVMMPSPLP